MKTLIGRLIRFVERSLGGLKITLEKESLEILRKIKSIYAQSFLSKKKKEEYKEARNKVLYSFHA